MNTKLTLSLNKEVIDQAKDYAKKNNVSLSFIIENYLLKIISDYKSKSDVKGSIVSELSGIIKLENNDYKQEYTNYLEKKYK